jgi:leucyl-tRNA---protein transferase
MHDAATMPPIPPPVRLPLVTLPQEPCPYLPERALQMRAFCVPRITGTMYHAFLDAGFRRSGRVIYQPVCRGCRACMSLRVPVERFAPSKSQRRCRRRNADLAVTVAPPRPTDEKHELYCRYLRQWHGREASDNRESFESFLYESPVEAIEFEYRDSAGRLLAVGICDLCPRALSSVYFYFEPEHSARGLGTYGALWEIDYARQHGLPWYYLGFWVVGCDAMQYKSSYRPHQVLHPDGVWREDG